MPRDVTADLIKPSFNQTELLSVILAFFGNAEMPSLTIQRFSKDASIYNLVVETNNEGIIARILLSDDFPSTEFENLKAKIAATLSEHTDLGVGQEVLFSFGLKVTGYFRYRDEFAIFPVPQTAPQPPMSYAQYPFIIQFLYRSCPHSIIDFMRRQRKTEKYVKILNLLLNTAITWKGNSVHSEWVLSDQPATNESKLLQCGYAYPDFKHVVPGQKLVMPESAVRLQEVPYTDYYVASHKNISQDLAIPDNLEQSLDRIFLLDGDPRIQFEKALAWHSAGVKLWEVSVSSAYIGLVTALECLLEPQTRSACVQCNQPIFATAKRFRAFLQKYVPFIDQFPIERDQLYKVRSSLSHGSRLLQRDLEPWESFNDSIARREEQLFRTLERIAGIAMYNWLWVKASSDY